MSSATDTFVRWSPLTDSDRAMVAGELEAILASHHFRNSKRYPALLKYVVARTLDGHADELKERTLGVEVFERAVNYDTGSDPVVRFTASEVRKRIAQFYRDAGRDSAVEIDLPLGSYVPEFRLRSAAAQVEDTELEPAAELSANGDVVSLSEPAGPPARRPQVFTRPAMRWLAAALLLIVTGAWQRALRRMCDTVHKQATQSPSARIQSVRGNQCQSQ